MQELRLVLIIVGGLAIAGLLVHGIWTSKKEGKAKFANKPLNKVGPKVDTPLADDVEEGIVSHASPVKERKEPAFHADDNDDDLDPLFGRSDVSFAAVDEAEAKNSTSGQEHTKSINIDEPVSSLSSKESETMPPSEESQSNQVKLNEDMSQNTTNEEATENTSSNEMEVIVFHVHAAGTSEFIGTQLFDSMQQHGLHYGAMDIFHCHTDTSGTGKVIFSVANMMNPGTLAHDDPATFSTKGISFFMTLPCFGDPDQNFKLMLKTAQQIADDLGANVLDDKRNLMTPDRLSAYRQQIRNYMAR